MAVYVINKNIIVYAKNAFEAFKMVTDRYLCNSTEVLHTANYKNFYDFLKSGFLNNHCVFIGKQFKPFLNYINKRLNKPLQHVKYPLV